MPKNRKSIKNNPWSNLRAEIAQLSKTLPFSKDEFSEVGINEWNDIEKKIWARFSHRENSSWIWETLIEPFSVISVDYDSLKFEFFIQKEESVWFLFNESLNGKTKFWGFEGTVDAFDKIFWELTDLDEVFIVSKKYEWILILNHHDALIGTGEMKDKIDALK